MYPVSEKYSALIAAPVRYTGISGTVTLKNGEALAVSDKNIKQGTLTITDKLNRQGDFRPGGVYSSELSVSLKGFGGAASDLDGAQVELEFRIFEDDSFAAYEAVPLGRFYVDGSTIERSFDTVSFKANDCLMLFDRAITGDRSSSLYELVSIACANCGVPLAMSEEEFVALPNGTLTASVNTARIQTERDLMMYAALCTGTFLSADRDTGGAKFVPLSCTKDDGGMIIPVREINIRTTTKFSDDTTRVTRLFTRRSGEKVMSPHQITIIAGSAKPITLELMENPLLAGLSENELGTALDEVLYQVGRCLNRAFRTTFNGDPALEIGDYVRLRGGAIDTARGYATGMITSSTWRYRGEHKIQCSLPSVVRGSSVLAVSAVSLLSDDETGEETEQYTQPKSQIEKRLDYLETLINGGNSGAGNTLKQYEVLSDTEITYNGTTYTFTAGESGEITGVTTDKGGSFTPTIPGTIANISAHNSAFMAVAMLSKLDKEPVEGDIPNSVVRFNTADYTVSGTTVIANNQCGEGEYEFRFGAIDDNAFKVIPTNSTTQGYGTALLPSALNKYTIYIVVNCEANSIRTAFVKGASGECFTVYGGGSGKWNTGYFQNLKTASYDHPSKKVFALVCDGTAARCYINGVQAVDWSFANELPQNLIFTNGEYLNSYFDGCAIWLYDLAISDAAHDAATVGEVSAMLMEKYNIGGTT